jgi:hypothetical protein
MTCVFTILFAALSSGQTHGRSFRGAGARVARRKVASRATRYPLPSRQRSDLSGESEDSWKVRVHRPMVTVVSSQATCGGIQAEPAARGPEATTEGALASSARPRHGSLDSVRSGRENRGGGGGDVGATMSAAGTAGASRCGNA